MKAWCIASVYPFRKYFDHYGDYSQIFDSDAYKASAGSGKTALENNWLYEQEGSGWQTHVWERKAGKTSGPPGQTTSSEDGLPIVMYEEGIYVGYKYWETAYADGYLQDVYGGTGTIYDTCMYASECVLACTWNADLAYEWACL